MIIPWQVDVPQNRHPFSNWLLIIGIIIAFIFQTLTILDHEDKIPQKLKEYENHTVEQVARDQGIDNKQLKEIRTAVDSTCDELKKIFPKKEFPPDFKDELIKESILEQTLAWGKARPFVLDRCSIKGLLGHIWLHGGLIHLAGNLLFLWVFGNAVCAKIGNILHWPIYITFGIFAGIAHLFFQGGAVIGASGAIMGVVGMFLVFFPTNDITCYFVWFFLLRPVCHEFTLSSYWMILFWIAFDIFGASRGQGSTAYFAHLGGFAAGISLAILMLKMKWIVMEKDERSLLQLWQERNTPTPEPHRTSRGLFPHNFEDQQTETDPGIDAGKIDNRPPEPEYIDFEFIKPPEEFIRFVCTCGKKVKIQARYAGRSAKCPNCRNKIKIPAQ